jgi:hypothetical protein
MALEDGSCKILFFIGWQNKYDEKIRKRAALAALSKIRRSLTQSNLKQNQKSSGIFTIWQTL